MRRRTSRSPAGRPNKRTVPRVGCKSPSNIKIVVVLPAPFGPTNATTLPRITRKETLRTAQTLRRRNRLRKILVRPSTSMTASLVALITAASSSAPRAPDIPCRTARPRQPAGFFRSHSPEPLSDNSRSSVSPPARCPCR